MKRVHKAVNWNDLENDIYKIFWDQNVRQFWVDEEIPIVDDKKDWESDVLSPKEKDTYEKVLAALTLLDTEQGGLGMPSTVMKIENLHAKAIFSFMGMMEQMHAKSYSTIFSTLSSTTRINELFEWVETNELLQKKVEIITSYYEQKLDEDPLNLYRSLCASVLLETYMFYSGFFYPLWWSGRGKLIRSAEIISLIVRDESIHGIFTGLMAQQEIDKLDYNTKTKLQNEVYDVLKELHEIEILYTKDLYEELGLYDEVITYVMYNADKALMNLGLEPYFNVDEEDVSPTVINGISTETKNHDFFSTKGNGYIKTTNSTEIDDNVFKI